MVELSDFDLGWLVGFLEGEGYFGARTLSLGGPKQYIRLSVGSTDIDVLERASSLMGGCRIKPMKRDPRHADPKPFYRIDLSGRAAFEVLRAVSPHMGARRREVIEAAIVSDGRWVDETAVPSRSGRRSR